jgi:hypothetical protein
MRTAPASRRKSSSMQNCAILQASIVCAYKNRYQNHKNHHLLEITTVSEKWHLVTAIITAEVVLTTKPAGMQPTKQPTHTAPTINY